MTRILFTALLCIFFYAPLLAQNKGVSIHADPRLAMLINKSKPVERPEPPGRLVASVSPKKERMRTEGTKIPASRIEDVRREVNTFVAEKNIPVKDPPKSGKPTLDDLKAQHRANMRASTVGSGYKGAGYRVQIYNGTSREEAMRVKAEFMHNYPGIHSYFSYVAPHYRIKVGDFRRREEALGLFKEANGTYSPCMIVPDAIGSR